ncbi:MAG: DUF2220 family protein [Pirellula sp.]|jgi:hypothetical protein|nr:DUF2220 family protein [Pirellula sp.]
MISPEELHEKMERLYPKAVRAYLEGDATFFPYRMRVDLAPPKSIPDAIREIDALRSGSKEYVGHGYSIRWQERRSRTLGQNAFPDEVTVETMDDLLRALGKVRWWQRLLKAVDTLRQRHPKLQSWIISNWQRLVGCEDRVDVLLDVVDHLLQHPRPNCFVRELPIAMSTKWVAEHEAMLSQWLDIVLPPSSIDVTAGSRDFARRYGFRSVSEHIRIRFLDRTVQLQAGFPCSELSLPLEILQSMPIDGARLIFVENKVNWLTLPEIPKGVAFGGLGRGIAQLFSVPWIAQSPLLYWGDIDVEGLEILAMVRSEWPHIASILMDDATLESHRAFATAGTGRICPIPVELHASEAAAMRKCMDRNLRVEQEHIPQSTLLDALNRFDWNDR